MRSLDAQLEHGYCSIIVANHELITVIRFVAKSYTHFLKSFANKFRLVLHAYKRKTSMEKPNEAKISSLELQIGSRFCLRIWNPIVHLSTVCTVQSMFVVNGYEIQTSRDYIFLFLRKRKGMQWHDEQTAWNLLIFFPQIVQHNIRIDLIVETWDETIPA